MQLENNLEIFKEPKLIEKLAQSFSKELADKIRENASDIAEFGLFHKVLNVKLENEFGEGKNVLTRYSMSSPTNNDESVYINIAKSEYHNDGKEKEKIEKYTEDSFILHSDQPVIYDIVFFNSPNRLEQSHFHYFDKLTDYDRVLNPEYYVGRQDHIDLNDHSYEEEEEIIDLSPDQEYKSIYKNNIQHVLNILNEKLQDDEKIYFNQSETSLERSKIADLIEVLEIDYMKPDGLAETTDNLKDDTYIYLWNNLVKFNEMLEDSGLNYKIGKDELSVGDLWDFIPENHQKNIIHGLSEVKELKLKNGIVLSSITPTDVFGDIQEDKKMFMVSSKDTTENHLTKIFKDKEEGNKYFKTYSQDKRHERLPF